LTDFHNFFTAVYNNELRNKNLLKFSPHLKLRKSVNICLSYRKNKSVSFFVAHFLSPQVEFSTTDNFALPVLGETVSTSMLSFIQWGTFSQVILLTRR